MLEASTFDYFIDMLMVDYHIYVLPHFGIIIEQPTKLFSANSSKNICGILKLNLNYNFFPKLLIMYIHSNLHLKLLGHVHT
jgi:hypothetical protein